jgi:Helicase associated domain
MKTEQMKAPTPLQLAPSPAKPIRVRNKNSDDNLWILKFEACKEYIEINGNSNIQTNYECTLPGVDGKCKLGIWLNRQKFNKKSNVLRDDRFQMLDQLVQEGKLSWPGEQATTAPPDAPAESTDVGVDHTYSIGVTDDAAWIQKVNLLKSLSREGNSNITSSYVSSLSDGTTVRLGLWLKKQRQMRKGGMLKPNREAILQQMVDEGMPSFQIRTRHKCIA